MTAGNFWIITKANVGRLVIKFASLLLFFRIPAVANDGPLEVGQIISCCYVIPILEHPEGSSSQSLQEEIILGIHIQLLVSNLLVQARSIDVIKPVLHHTHRDVWRIRANSKLASFTWSCMFYLLYKILFTCVQNAYFSLWLTNINNHQNIAKRNSCITQKTLELKIKEA